MDDEPRMLKTSASLASRRQKVVDTLKFAWKKTCYYVLKRPEFCCCAPARWGVVLISFLSGAVTSVLMVSLWFEVASNDFANESTRVIFVFLSLLETAGLIASILGFVGAFTRKQLFVLVYTCYLYFFFVVFLIASLYVLIMITETAEDDIDNICHAMFISSGTQTQCSDLLKVTTGILWGVAGIILAFNLYGAFVCTRYVYQLRREKSELRQSRIQRNSVAYEKVYKRRSGLSTGNIFSPIPTSAISADLEQGNEGAIALTERSPIAMTPNASGYRPQYVHDRHRSDMSTAGLLAHAQHDSHDDDEMYHDPYEDHASSPQR